MLANFFRRILSPKPSPEGKAASALYAQIVAQARQPAFFEHMGVPDTVEGRFELIAVHGYALMSRLKEHGREAEALNQTLFDTLFRDMDDNLRELGVSDLKVGPRIKKMAQAFYGRAVAFERGLDDDDPTVLEDAILRNIYATANPRDDQVRAIATYLREVKTSLLAQRLDDLMAGRVEFAPVPPAISADIG